jgi:menaquinone-specific isochorismate synthase
VTTVPEVSVRAVRTVAVDDPGPLLDLLPADGALAWVREGEGLVGWGEAARLDVDDPAPFAEAQ